jgi:hypothetical protein
MVGNLYFRLVDSAGLAVSDDNDERRLKVRLSVMIVIDYRDYFLVTIG